MSTIEIIGAILLISSCLAIVLLVLSQDSSKGLSQSITGSSNDNFYQKNSGRTKEAMLKRATKVLTIILFVTTIAVNVFAIFGKTTENTTGEEPAVDLSEQFDISTDSEETEAAAEETSAEDVAAADDTAGTEAEINGEEVGEETGADTAVTESDDAAVEAIASEASEATEDAGQVDTDVSDAVDAVDAVDIPVETTVSDVADVADTTDAEVETMMSEYTD